MQASMTGGNTYILWTILFKEPCLQAGLEVKREGFYIYIKVRKEA